MTPGPAVAPTIAPVVVARAGDRDETTNPYLLDAVTDLRRDVDRTRLLLPIKGHRAAERLRRRVLDQMDDHLLPRLRELSAPAVVVVAGSTGAGKSTLVNSLLGTEVSAAGVLRPTTKEPVLAHHSADAELLAAHPLLEIVDVKVHDAVPRGMTLIDAPDLDSLLASNRETAARLLDAADLWVFLTTAARYGDALPWDVLAQAAERGVSMAMVLNRVPRAAITTVRADLMRRLRERGMGTVPLFLIPDLGPHEGMLDPAMIAPIRRWLAMVAGPDRARSVILRTQRGTLRRLHPWIDQLADAVQAQVDARADLEKLVAEAVAAPAEKAAASCIAGCMVTGPVRASWTGAVARPGPLSGRWAARGKRAVRVQALSELAAELLGTVSVALAGDRRAGEAALERALAGTSLPGARAVPTHATRPEAATATTPPEAATATTPPEVAAAATPPEKATATDGALPATAVDGAPPEPGEDVGRRSVVHTPPTPEESAEAWMLAALHAVPDLTGSAGRRSGRTVEWVQRLGGDEAASTLLALAAAGLTGASAVLADLAGPRADAVVRRLREDLGARAAEQVRAAAGPAMDFLSSPDLADDAAAALRLRFAVLKRMR
jgi:energy-coupling factor transporter ATP-binding protein EcfA2